MKVVITVIGKDRTGIIARVSGLLYEVNVNILDITQTILEDLFAMIMLVDTSDAEISFEELQACLNKQGEEMGVEVRTQRADLFDAMNRI